MDNSSIFLSIEVSDVDALHQKAQQQGIDIIYPICNESWGSRRFFVKGPNGETINILGMYFSTRVSRVLARFA